MTTEELELARGKVKEADELERKIQWIAEMVDAIEKAKSDPEAGLKIAVTGGKVVMELEDGPTMGKKELLGTMGDSLITSLNTHKAGLEGQLAAL